MFEQKVSIYRFGNLVILLLAFIISMIVFTNCSNKSEIKHVGILCGLNFFANTVDGFKAEMKELGYIEGKNIVYDYRESKSNVDMARQIIKKFIADKVDLIFVLPTSVAVIAKELTKGTGIPVLFANANVEEQNLINSIKSPGNNITGVRYPGPDIAVKRFELIIELYPNAKKIWVPFKKGLRIVPSQLEVLRNAAKLVGVELLESPVDDVNEIRKVLKEFDQSNGRDFDAILMIVEPLAVTPDTFIEICKYAYENRIPIGGSTMSVEGYESLFGISTDNVAVGKQAAPLAKKILSGINAGNIPVISAENYLEININAAKRFGLILPESLLKQADKIILD